ncbi:MAG TPA: ECF-type sigma factor [Candidatus Polarisedimenticolia bacterium]|jgi:RNA polymerase sigma factor (TIGR02999 family)|nr:ECF-type sigma factor [Candidatus Polarisedimenticolia bacterium]
MDDRDTISTLLRAHRGGDRGALDRLMPLVYDDLHRLARRQLAGEGGRGRTLDTTGLVHEAYLRLAGSSRAVWEGRGHFFAVSARAMRQIVVDYARERGAAKRGGGVRSATLDDEGAAVESRAEEILAVDQALAGLGALDPHLPQLVECRFFAGLTEEETAEALALPLRTVQRDWARARAWLKRALGGGTPPGSPGPSTPPVR